MEIIYPNFSKGFRIDQADEKEVILLEETLIILYSAGVTCFFLTHQDRDFIPCSNNIALGADYSEIDIISLPITDRAKKYRAYNHGLNLEIIC